MARIYLLFDARACGDCGQNGPPDEANCLATEDSDGAARKWAGEFGDMACYSYELAGSKRRPKAVDERWEWDWYVRGGFLHLDGMTYLKAATSAAARQVDAKWAKSNPLRRIAQCRIEEIPDGPKGE